MQTAEGGEIVPGSDAAAVPPKSSYPQQPAVIRTCYLGCDDTVKDGDDECVICFNEYQCSEVIKQLPCKHCYHAACIDSWLARNAACPLCKQPVWEPTALSFLPLWLGAFQGNASAGVQHTALSDSSGSGSQPSGTSVLLHADAGGAMEGPATAECLNQHGTAVAIDGHCILMIHPRIKQMGDQLQQLAAGLPHQCGQPTAAGCNGDMTHASNGGIHCSSSHCGVAASLQPSSTNTLQCGSGCLRGAMVPTAETTLNSNVNGIVAPCSRSYYVASSPRHGVVKAASRIYVQHNRSSSPKAADSRRLRHGFSSVVMQC